MNGIMTKPTQHNVVFVTLITVSGDDNLHQTRLRKRRQLDPMGALVFNDFELFQEGAGEFVAVGELENRGRPCF